MTKRAKPDFSHRPGFKGGFGANPDYLPHDVRNELMRAVKSSDVNPAQQEKLVAFANELAQRPDTGDESIGIQRDQIDKVASDANRLMASLKGLTGTTIGTLATYTKDACVVPPSPLSVDMVELIREIGPADFMSQSWDLVEALKIVAEHTSEQLGLLASKGSKPLEGKQRALVASLAAKHYQLIDALPPADDAAWFARFVRVLGGAMGLHFENADARQIAGQPFIGSRLVKSGIELAAKP